MMLEFPYCRPLNDKKRQQPTSPRFDPANVLQPRCLQPSILTLTFQLHPPPPRTGKTTQHTIHIPYEMRHIFPYLPHLKESNRDRVREEKEKTGREDNGQGVQG